MRRIISLCCCAGVLTVMLGAQAPQNPSLAGAEVAAPIPETNPFSSEADIQAGEALFQKHCSYCHGSFGEGGRGADLTAGVYRRGGRDPELYSSIRNGIPGSEMAPVRVTDDEVEAAMRALFTDTHNVAEGAGAAALAALLADRERAPGRPAAVVLCGGNVDAAVFARVLAAG